MLYISMSLFSPHHNPMQRSLAPSQRRRPRPAGVKLAQVNSRTGHSNPTLTLQAMLSQQAGPSLGGLETVPVLCWSRKCRYCQDQWMISGTLDDFWNTGHPKSRTARVKVMFTPHYQIFNSLTAKAMRIHK